MSAISRVEIERFASEIAGRLGLAVDFERGMAGVLAVMQDRLRETAASSVTDYFSRITQGEVSALAERLTVGETYFFRYREQFEALKAVLPTLVARRRGDRPLRILSAGCSSGEEPGTIAIVLRSLEGGNRARYATILAVDVNPAAIRKAKRGCYSEWSLRETPEVLRSRWFRARGHEFELDPDARSLVTFAEKNLGALNDDLWQSETYDVVFCRNALMYFTEEAAQAVIFRIVRSLALGGLLFLGPTETHLGQVPGLRVRHSHGTFYYERVEENSGLVPSAPASSSARLPVTEVADRRAHVVAIASQTSIGAPSTPEHATGDVRTESLRALSRPALEPAGDLPEVTHLAGPPAEVTHLIDLLRQDRIADALLAVPTECHPDPEAHLVRAILLAGTGNMSGAEDACAAALALNPLHAGARYLLALCREHAEDNGGAIEHDHAAAYLEPRFALPHLHLGLLARRRGDLAEARRELRLAAALLAEDDDARVLLLGGGLRREALIELCRAELRACGGGT